MVAVITTLPLFITEAMGSVLRIITQGVEFIESPLLG
jgi:hypothetical protein